MKKIKNHIYEKTLLIISALLMTIISQANTITVNNINDSGAGSLREASIDANSGDTIQFSPSLLTAAVDSISLVTEIDFGNKAIVIKGLYTATDTLFISGANSSRIFSFNGAGKVVLDSLVLINGNGVGTTHPGSGGAVLYTEGTDTLHILNSIIRNNSAIYGGGALSYSTTTSSSSSITVNNSTISGNTANNNGGGIYSITSTSPSNTTSVIVNNSMFSGNTVNNNIFTR